MGAERRRRGVLVTGGLVLLIAWDFIYFFPLYSGFTIPYPDRRSRLWLDTWF
jgi:dolichyl-phosphate-mannose-protein mannosyltransferase